MRFVTKLLARPTDSWSWSSDAFPPLSFCVRTLVLDGLAIPPFDQHASGDGRLRLLGLDAGMWREWVASILHQREVSGEYARAIGTPETQGLLLERARAAGEVMRAPGSFCPGPEALRTRLNELFADYAPEGEAWKWRMSHVPRLHGSPRQQRALWRALKPFHDRLPTLSVFLVEYTDPVVMPLPPTTCLIAPGDRPDGFRQQVAAAAEALASPATIKASE